METTISPETDNDIQEIQSVFDEPEAKDLLESYRSVLADLSSEETLQQQNYETRHCIWAGQTDDQRKHSRTNGKEPFPWDGASDLKIPVVDEIIRWGVALDCTALKKANIRAMPVGADDFAKSAIVTSFMRWLVMSQMVELDREANLLANYRREKGKSVLGVFWERQESWIARKLRMAELEQAAPDVAQAITAGLYEDEIVALVQKLAPELKKARAKKMIKELREKGETSMPQRALTVNRPIVRAFALDEDLFVPSNTTDIQNASVIFRRQFFTPAALHNKVLTDGWDEEHVDKAIEKGLGQTVSPSISDARQRQDAPVLSIDKHKDMVEVVYAYRAMVDEDGVRGIYLTVFCPAAVSDDNCGFASHSLLDYAHGKFPFVLFKREEISRSVLDSRGEPELYRGFQSATKVEMDARVDNASLATCPPLAHPVGREPTAWGPGARVPERRPGEYHFADIPPPATHSVEVQDRLETMLRKYVGRPTSPEDAQEAMIRQQHDINAWLSPWKEVFTMVWDLYQQYGEDEEYFRVLGVQSEQAQKFSKAEFSPKYDFYLSFDVLNTDPETMLNKIKEMSTLAGQFDRFGQVDTSKLLNLIFQAIDPVIAEEVLVPKENATNKEILDTQNDIAKMTSGIDVDVPQNAAAEIRLQTLQGWMQGPPDNPATDVQQQLQSNEPLQKRVKRYSDQLQFILTQRQNAQIGRIGTAPASQTPLQ